MAELSREIFAIVVQWPGRFVRALAVAKPKLSRSVLQLRNEAETDKLLLIEPHLEQYVMRPHASFKLVFQFTRDGPNTIPPEVEWRDEGLVVFPPGEYAPYVYCDGELLEPKII